MRILHVLGALNRGGVETWLVQVLKHIDRSRYQFDFLVHSADPAAYDEEVRALGARILPCPNPSNLLQYGIDFCRILRRYGPYDCIHSHVHYYSGYILMLAATQSVPMRIAQSHNDLRTVESGYSFLRRAYVSGAKALIRHFATVGVAVSELAAQDLFSESWKSDPRWRCEPLGIDLQPFNVKIEPRQVRAQLGIPSGAFVVGHVGRFAYQKNHRFIVDIAQHLCRLAPNAVFLLVGEGPLQPEIKQMVRSRGLADHFIFTGARSDVPQLMKGAMDCFLLPSIHEGLPLALVEAQAAGLICLVSDCVSNESDIGAETVGRLSLDDPPAKWASRLRRLESKNDIASIPADWLRDRSIDASTASMESLYASEIKK